MSKKWKEILDDLLKRVKGTWFVNNKSVYLYENGYYSLIDKNTQEKLISLINDEYKFLQPSVITNLRKKLIYCIDQIDEDVFYNELEKGIPFINGVFDLGIGEFRIYKETDHFLNPIQRHIEKTDDFANNVKWFISKVKDWVGNNYDWFINLMSYFLFIQPNVENIWCNFYGRGSNGKSLCLNLMREILQSNKTIGINLHHINQFTSSSFKDIWLIIGDDTEAKINRGVSPILKELASADRLTVEYKGESKVQIRNISKLIVSTNDILKTYDNSYGFYRRYIPIIFPNEFKLDDSLFSEFKRRLGDITLYLLQNAYEYRTQNISLKDTMPSEYRNMYNSVLELNNCVLAWWNNEFCNDDGSVNKGKLREYSGKKISDVYDKYAQWYIDTFDTEDISPALNGRNCFGGKNGALLRETPANKYFEYYRKGEGRVLKLKDVA